MKAPSKDSQTHAPAAPELPRAEISAIKARSALSIANMLSAGAKQEAAEVRETVLKEPFSDQELAKAWELYADMAAKDKRNGLLTAMNAADVHCAEDDVLQIAVSSSTAAHELEENMLGILAFLKKTLRNTQISHRITVSENIRERMPYTPREKYEYLRKKNPLLENMRGELDLNIDF